MDAYDKTTSYREQNRTTALLALWTLAWLATVALARFGPEMLWDSQSVASWLAITLNVAVGIAWIVSFARFLRAQDELWRKISLDALAATLGVGWVVGFGYILADAAGLIASDVDIALFPALLGIVYIVAVGVGWIRYR